MQKKKYNNNNNNNKGQFEVPVEQATNGLHWLYWRSSQEGLRHHQLLPLRSMISGLPPFQFLQ